MKYLGCEFCKHRKPNSIQCKAFDRIPSPILSGEISHTSPLPAQSNAIVFELLDELQA